jgi:eukaryotic-like serine/threonine-protein kinase
MTEQESEPLAGKYRLIRLLGQGGMGSVWQAEHVTLHAMVAVKLLDSTVALTRDGLNRFLREAQAAASLRSPHIVQILDHGIHRGVPYIAMELLEGETLGDRLDRLGCLSPAQTSRIVAHVARAITRAHDAGIVHRDLKPDNIFLVPNDDEELIKVLDFGIAKSASPVATSISDSTRTGTMLGTPYYMSPEQVESAASADYRTDIWALGVIAYQCIVGQRPFDGETLGGLFLAICSKEFPVPSRRGHVPVGFDVWFSRCCARNPNERFASAREAAAELRRIATDDKATSANFNPDSAQPAQSFGNTTGQGAAVGYSTPPKSGSRLAFIALIAAGVAIGLLLGYNAVRDGSDSTPAATRAAADAAAATRPPTEPAPPPSVASRAIADSAPASDASATTSASSPPKRTAPPAPARPIKPRTQAPPGVDLGL